MHLDIEIYRYINTDINGKQIKKYQYYHLKEKCMEWL